MRSALRMNAYRRELGLLAASEVQRKKIGAVWEPHVTGQTDDAYARLHAAVDDKSYRGAWAEGESMTTDQAVAYAPEAAPGALGAGQPATPAASA